MSLIEEIPNNICQDQAFELNYKRKTRGKGYFHFCSFLSLEDVKKIEIAVNVPLERKRRVGRPKVTTKVLTKQPIKAHAIKEIGISSYKEFETEVIDKQPLDNKSRLEKVIKIGRPAG